MDRFLEALSGIKHEFDYAECNLVKYRRDNFKEVTNKDREELCSNCPLHNKSITFYDNDDMENEVDLCTFLDTLDLGG